MRKASYNFVKGEVLLIDKPLEWTSFDVVKKVRGILKRKLKVKKLKVGHAGTLDPLATGLLLICTGKMTKSANELLAEDKTYAGTIQLGISTPSYDLETNINKSVLVDNITDSQITECANKMEGEMIQIPPIYSAKRVDGERAYKKARKGESVEMKGKKVNIYHFDIKQIDLPFVDFEIMCSKGTYIRSIANDFGKNLNNLGTLVKLRRTKSGQYSIENAISIEEFEEILKRQPDPVSIC